MTAHVLHMTMEASSCKDGGGGGGGGGIRPYTASSVSCQNDCQTTSACVSIAVEAITMDDTAPSIAADDTLDVHTANLLPMTAVNHASLS